MEVIGMVLNLLIKIPAMVGVVERVVSACVVWWISRAKQKELVALANAAALGANAKTDKERIDAAIAWRDALSKPRVSQ